MILPSPNQLKCFSTFSQRPKMGLKYSRWYRCEYNRPSAEKNETTKMSNLSFKTPTTTIFQLPSTRPHSLSAPQLTDRQKELLIKSFNGIKENLSQIGVDTFLRLFETHPEVKGFFGDFKDLSAIDELPQSKILRQHGLRIMNFLEKCISRIYDMKKMDALIQELGHHHQSYGAPAEYIHLVGPQLILAIQSQLDSKWDQETEQAWLALFSYITINMNRAMKHR